MAKKKAEQLALSWEQSATPIEFVHPSKLKAWPGLNARTHFPEEKIEALAKSIKKHGVLQNIVAKKMDGQEDWVISGESRLRSATIADALLPVRYVDVDEAEALQINMIENLQRGSLTAMEEARGFARMMKALDLTQQKLATVLSLSQSVVSARLALLDVPEQIQALVELEILPASLVRDYLHAWTKETPAKRTRFFTTLVQLINTRPEPTEHVSVIWLKPVVAKLKDTIGATAKPAKKAAPAKKTAKRKSNAQKVLDELSGKGAGKSDSRDEASSEDPPAGAVTTAPVEDGSEVAAEDGGSSGDATCIFCKCTDSAPCAGGCSWLSVNREAGVGICSFHRSAEEMETYLQTQRTDIEPMNIAGLTGALMPLLEGHSVSVTYHRMQAALYVVVAPKSLGSKKEVQPLALSAPAADVEAELIAQLPGYIAKLNLEKVA